MGTWLAADKASFINTTLNITSSKHSPHSDFVEKEAEKILKVSFSQNIFSLLLIKLQEFVEPVVIDQAAYILLALGSLIFIISFLGYCGAIKESRALLVTYGIFLIIIITLQVITILLNRVSSSSITLRLVCYFWSRYTSHKLTTIQGGSSSPHCPSTTPLGLTRMPSPTVGT